MVNTRKENRKRRKSFISQRLKGARISVNMTKADLARKVCIPYTTYDAYERGDREPDIDTIMCIADALGVEWRLFVQGGCET